jgi:hypothetical protein
MHRRCGGSKRKIGPDGRLPLPPPWAVDEPEACFIVKDNNGRALA